MAATQPSVQSAATAKKEAVLQFSIAIDEPGTHVADVVEAIRKAANIGSSGQDGFAVDSFFDITYKMGASTGGSTMEVEIHAVPNNPDMNPGTVIDKVKLALDSQVKVKEYTGHVTLLK